LSEPGNLTRIGSKKRTDIIPQYSGAILNTHPLATLFLWDGKGLPDEMEFATIRAYLAAKERNGRLDLE
jgi:hypothetical protein